MIISLFYVILAAADHDKRITVSLVLFILFLQNISFSGHGCQYCQ